MKYDHELEQREYWRAYLRDRSLTTLARRFGVSTVTVWLGEQRPIQSLTDAQNAELQKLRKEYHEAKERHMSKYQLQTIADRYGVRIKRLPDAMKRRERRAERAYRDQEASA